MLHSPPTLTILWNSSGLGEMGEVKVIVHHPYSRLPSESLGMQPLWPLICPDAFDLFRFHFLTAGFVVDFLFVPGPAIFSCCLVVYLAPVAT
jgi:hypothetical protein